MNAYLLSFLLICVCVSGAPSPAENGKLQNRPNSDEKEVETEVISPQKTTVIPRREIVSDSKRRRCENCRKLRRCKVHQMCDMCNVLCKDIDLSQLQISDVGDSTPENDQSLDAVDNSGSQAAKLVEPKDESATSGQSKEDLKSNESSATLDDNNASVHAETVPVDDKSNQMQSELRAEIEKEVNLAMEEKKRKLTRDELRKIVTNAKALQDRRANREGLLQLRSRIPSSKNSSEPTSVDSSKDKSLLGNRLSTTKSLLKPKNSSFGLRKKLNDNKQANPQDSAEIPPSKANNQSEFESVTEHTTVVGELWAITTQLPHRIKQNSEENFDDVLQLQHIKQDAHTETHGGINKNELSITPERFSMILKSLEEKVENIADLVRNTCRHYHPEGEHVSKTNSLPELNQRLSVPEEEEGDNIQPSKVEKLPDRKISNSDEKSRHSESSPFDNGFSDFSASAPRYNINNDNTYPRTSLNTEQEEPTNELSLRDSLSRFNKEDPESDQEQDLTFTDANGEPLRNVISSKTTESSFGENNEQNEDEDEDQHFKPSILHKPINKHHGNVFDPNAGNAQNEDEDQHFKPSISHKPTIQHHGNVFDPNAGNVRTEDEDQHLKPSISHKPIIQHHGNVFDPNAGNVRTEDEDQHIKPSISHKPIIQHHGNVFDPNAGNVRTEDEDRHFKPSISHKPTIQHHGNVFDPNAENVQSEDEDQHIKPSISHKPIIQHHGIVFEPNAGNAQNEDEDRHFKPSISHKPTIQHHGNAFDPNARNAQESDINRDVRPLHKHIPFIPKYSPSEIGSFFDSSAAHADPHKVLSHFKPIQSGEDSSDNAQTHLLPSDGKEEENPVPTDASKTLHSGNDKVVSHVNPTLSQNIDKFPADSTSDNADNDQSQTDLTDFGNEMKEAYPTPTLNQRFSGQENSADEQLGSPSSGSNHPSHPFGMVGKIIPQDPKSSDKVMFVSSGMQLPFYMKKGDDGSYQLSVDTDKLCPSCQSGVCKPAVSNGGSESRNKLTHKISKRDLQEFDSYSNIYKKRKPMPLEKKKLTKTKRSNSESKESDKYKFITHLLSDSFVKNQNGKNSVGNQNKIDKQYVDVIQQRIKLLNNVLKWWRSFIEDKM